MTSGGKRAQALAALRPRSFFRGHSGTLAQTRLLAPDPPIPFLPGHVDDHDHDERAEEHPADEAVLRKPCNEHRQPDETPQARLPRSEPHRDRTLGVIPETGPGSIRLSRTERLGAASGEASTNPLEEPASDPERCGDDAGSLQAHRSFPNAAPAEQPLARALDKVRAQLREVGCHPNGIADALNAADRDQHQDRCQESASASR